MEAGWASAVWALKEGAIVRSKDRQMRGFMLDPIRWSLCKGKGTPM